MLKKKYEKAPPKTKYFKIKYSLTEVRTTAEIQYLEECNEPRLDTKVDTAHHVREAILIGQNECTRRSHFKDIMQGCVQLHNNNLIGCFCEGATFAQAERSDGSSFDGDSIITSILTILELNEYDP